MSSRTTTGQRAQPGRFAVSTAGPRFQAAAEELGVAHG
jgi:hypothetical protein